MAVKKKKKAKKRVRRFAVGGGTTTGTTITKDNNPSGGLGQGGQNSGSSAPSPSAAPSAPSPPSAGPTQNSPTPASGAPGAPGGISSLGGRSAESALSNTESSLKKGSGIGGVSSIEKGPISSTQTGSQAPSKTANLAPSAPSTTGTRFGGPSTQGMGAGLNAGPVGVGELDTARKLNELGRIGAPAQTAPNGSYYGPKTGGISELGRSLGSGLTDNALTAAKYSVGERPDGVPHTRQDAKDLGRLMHAESDNIRNEQGEPKIGGYVGVGEVVRNRVMSDQFPIHSKKVSGNVAGIMRDPYQFTPFNKNKAGVSAMDSIKEDPVATRVAESVLSGINPRTVGNSLNYGNRDHIKNAADASELTKQQFRDMNVVKTIADARNPRSQAHDFGNLGRSDISFDVAGGVYSATPSTEPQVADNSAISADQKKKDDSYIQSIISSGPTGLPPSDVNLGGMSYTPDLPQMPRSAAGTYTSPYDPKRKAAGTFTDSYNPEVQGPVRYGGNLDKIPEPNGIGMLPAAPRNPITGMSYTPGLPENTLRPAAETYTSPYNPEVQGPVRFSAGLPSIPKPTGATMVGVDSIISGDPRASMTPGSYPAAPEEEILGEPEVVPEDFVVPQDPSLENPGSIIGAYNGVKGLLSSVDSTLAKGWNTISTPNEGFRKAAETYGPAHSLMGRIGGYDKQWDKEVSEGVKPAVDSLKQTLTRMQDNLRQAMAGPSPEDAQRGADTVKKAEGTKIQDRLPGAATVQAGSEGQYTVSEPTEFGITLGDPGKTVTTAYKTDAEEFGRLSDMYNRYNEAEMARQEAEKRAAGEYGPDVVGDDARKLAKGAGFGPNVRYNDDFLSDPERLGVTDGTVNPEDLSPVDMAKIHNRSMANKYEKMDPNLLTKEEKETLTASKAVKQAIKKAPGAGALMKVGEWWTEAEPVENYLGRPSYEKEQLRAMGREADIKYGRREANMPNTSGTTTNKTTTAQNSSLPSDSTGGKQEMYANWSQGIGIPSPEDPQYAEYIWWYNSGGGW